MVLATFNHRLPFLAGALKAECKELARYSDNNEQPIRTPPSQYLQQKRKQIAAGWKTLTKLKALSSEEHQRRLLEHQPFGYSADHVEVLKDGSKNPVLHRILAQRFGFTFNLHASSAGGWFQGFRHYGTSQLSELYGDDKNPQAKEFNILWPAAKELSQAESETLGKFVEDDSITEEFLNSQGKTPPHADDLDQEALEAAFTRWQADLIGKGKLVEVPGEPPSYSIPVFFAGAKYDWNTRKHRKILIISNEKLKNNTISPKSIHMHLPAHHDLRCAINMCMLGNFTPEMDQLTVTKKNLLKESLAEAPRETISDWKKFDPTVSPAVSYKKPHSFPGAFVVLLGKVDLTNAFF